MTKKELKQKLIAIRNGGFITPLLEELTGYTDKGSMLEQSNKEAVEAYKAELREEIEKYFDREIEIYSSPQMQQMYYAISPVKRLMTYKKDILNIIKGEK